MRHASHHACRHALSQATLPPDRVLLSPIDVRARAHDASHVLLYPQAVAVPRDADDVARLLRSCASAGVGITFRSGGTSLSGQAGTDAILADVRRNFDSIEVLDSGARVRVQPGVTVNRVNAALAPYGRAIGPDPASSAACTIGGVVANNSSGMACGTVENTYRTLESMVVVLASGSVIDTGAPDADDRLRVLEPDLYRGLLDLRRRIWSNPASLATIEQQFSMKNTMGYGLNSFVDHATPVEILAHLMIGSEGTLGFVASATFRTVPVRSHVHTGLLVFEDLFAANRALPDLVATGAATLELMDIASIRVGQSLPCPADQIAAIRPASQAALLVEYQATCADDLADLVAAARPVLAGLPVEQPVTLTSDAAVRDQLWSLRKGLYACVAAARQSGTTALLEDVVVPVASLAETCAQLTGLFEEFSYPDAVIFGHAKDGNIHFMITDRFDKELTRYERFTDALVDVVLGHQGSLKAEHGTGRVMAPFVRRQYGDELYEVMREVKRLFDPQGILNDGVVLTDDPRAHLNHIKVPAPVDPLVDACVECGYCEPVCPARRLTLTPRQRVAVRREISQAHANGDSALADELEREYVYSGVQTCAADGTCRTACPVGIDTGVYIKKLRARAASPTAQAGWALAADHWAGATHAASLALSTAQDLAPGAGLIQSVNRLGRRLVGTDQLPLWSDDLPGGGRSRRRRLPTRAPDAVYVPACVNSMFGPAQPGDGPSGVQVAFESLCAHAGVTLLVPDDIDSLCCGTPWTSKGMTRGRDAMAARVLASIEAVADHGRLPIVCDASSCTEGLQRMLADHAELTVLDCVQFTAEHLLPRLPEVRKVASITIHPTCSSTQIGLNPYLTAVAHAVAEKVTVPLDAGCCAFAGDRGMLHPELTASATAPEAREVLAADSEVHASCNRTCELGMARATAKPYRHVLEILADLVRE
ncbi:MAG: FAD-binding oxidoreductase [Propionibacteriaceae bacterium]|nr:FAD-binding oxidoreductase [Propionibacteriaceae bacterium]